ncbi:MAG: aminopeptidase P family protein [Thermotogae bacterium]|nr:aminopeptidase P family protein [Thermotogota bacterium]
MHYEKRRRKLIDQLKEKNIDAAFILNFENSSWASSNYLTGFTGSHAEILVTEEETYLITDGRYSEQASRETDTEVITISSTEDMSHVLKSLLEKHAVRRLGIEKQRITLSNYEKLKSLNVELESIDDILKKMRSVKEKDEITVIKEAVKVAEEVYKETVERLKPGMSEREIAALLEYQMKLRCEGPAFPTIVASGPASAMPHAKPTDRKIGRGDVVVVDFGARVKGYVSDITRTLVVGSVDSMVDEVINAVCAAQDAVFQGFKPGMTGKEVDALARKELEKAGFAQYFPHSLGHGIGLEVHEGSAFSQSNGETVPVGSVMTVEPGVYITGKFGVRIEEDVIVTQTGLERLTTLPRTPMKI